MVRVHEFALPIALASALLAALAAPGVANAQSEFAVLAEPLQLDLGRPHWDHSGATVWDDLAGTPRGSFSRHAASEHLAAVQASAADETDPVFEPRIEKASFGGADVALTGRAGWYGADFDGRLTATGERFDMYRLTAASGRFPLNAYVSVRNAATGGTVTVLINDRRPTDEGAAITLSQAAATRLGVDAASAAVVEMRYLGQRAADAPRSMRVASR
jgi:rare lipoprotein A (peptidoglycan hydrolase)